MFDVQHISFSWGRKPLLEDVSFSLAPGETAVLAGANGAGKTTLLKILAGVCLPSSGRVLVDGIDAFRQALRFRRMLGYLPEAACADPDLRVRKYLRYRANLRGEMTKKIRHRVAEAMELCGLEPYADVPVGTLSFGLRKRVALADAVLLRPRFLLLDDLLAGLDHAGLVRAHRRGRLLVRGGACERARTERTGAVGGQILRAAGRARGRREDGRRRADDSGIDAARAFDGRGRMTRTVRVMFLRTFGRLWASPATAFSAAGFLALAGGFFTFTLLRGDGGTTPVEALWATAAVPCRSWRRS